ncbi:unnamed protein product, partial [marine sediment metagenome]
DAWLEKLQEEMLTAWTKDENRLTKVIVERGRRLEAITEWFVENGAFHCDVHDLIGLRKILEG